MKTLAAKLSEIQSKLVAPKSQTNTFGKYKYRNCEDILTALKPHLGGLYVTVTDDLVMIGDRFYVKASATISDGENSISTNAFARESLDKKGMDSAQLTGSTSSYARKYALNGLFMIDDQKDADHSGGETSARHKSGTEIAKTKFVIDDLTKQWIAAVKADASALNQIEDQEFKQFIKQQVGK